jgi:hypothetical protein
LALQVICRVPLPVPVVALTLAQEAEEETVQGTLAEIAALCVPPAWV